MALEKVLIFVISVGNFCLMCWSVHFPDSIWLLLKALTEGAIDENKVSVVVQLYFNEKTFTKQLSKDKANGFHMQNILWVGTGTNSGCMLQTQWILSWQIYSTTVRTGAWINTLKRQSCNKANFFWAKVVSFLEPWDQNEILE